MKIELEVPDGFPLPLESLVVPRVGRQRTRKVVAYTTNPRGQRTSETLSCGHVLRPPPEHARLLRVCPSCEARLGRITRRFDKEPGEATVNVLDVIENYYRSQYARQARTIARLRAANARLVAEEVARKRSAQRERAEQDRRQKWLARQGA